MITIPKQFEVTYLEHKRYLALITILNTGFSVTTLLSDLSFFSKENENRLFYGTRVIVDYKVKNGNTKFRFTEYRLDATGGIILGSGIYTGVDNRILATANDVF